MGNICSQNQQLQPRVLPEDSNFHVGEGSPFKTEYACLHNLRNIYVKVETYKNSGGIYYIVQYFIFGHEYGFYSFKVNTKPNMYSLNENKNTSDGISNISIVAMGEDKDICLHKVIYTPQEYMLNAGGKTFSYIRKRAAPMVIQNTAASAQGAPMVLQNTAASAQGAPMVLQNTADASAQGAPVVLQSDLAIKIVLNAAIENPGLNDESAQITEIYQFNIVNTIYELSQCRSMIKIIHPSSSMYFIDFGREFLVKWIQFYSVGRLGILTLITTVDDHKHVSWCSRTNDSFYGFPMVQLTSADVVNIGNSITVIERIVLSPSSDRYQMEVCFKNNMHSKILFLTKSHGVVKY